MPLSRSRSGSALVSPLLAIAVWLLLVSGVPGSAKGQPTLPDGFAFETVTLGPFNSPPTGFAFLPDGRLLVIEKDSGDVHVVPVDDTASTVVATIPNLTNQLERGLLGIAVDPDWPSRPYVYFHSTQQGDVIHVSMYTVAGDLDVATSTNLSLANPYVLLDDIPDTASTHNGGTLRFGTDGHLYVSIGDDVLACEAQNLDSPRGKILRLDVAAMPGAGTGPPPKSDLVPAAGNPFGAGTWRQLVYAYGLRNPYRFTIHPPSGNLYIGDVGEITWEEISELVQSSYSGDNFGWPEFEGSQQDPLPGADDCSTAPFVSPIYQYANPPGPGGVAAVVCGPRYQRDTQAPSVFPRDYEDNLFLVDFYGGWMRRLEHDGLAWSLADSVPGQPNAEHWANGFTQISDLQQGPDGSLYYASFSGGAALQGVHRIVNTLPTDVVTPEGPRTFRVRIVPNPAKLGSGIRVLYHLADNEAVQLKIFDSQGRLVHWSKARSGADIGWKGNWTSRRPAAAGVYFYEARSLSGRRGSGKIVLRH